MHLPLHVKCSCLRCQVQVLNNTTKTKLMAQYIRYSNLVVCANNFLEKYLQNNIQSSLLIQSKTPRCLGALDITSKSGGLKLRAVAGKPSVTRLTSTENGKCKVPFRLEAIASRCDKEM